MRVRLLGGEGAQGFERARDRRLFDHSAVVAVVQLTQHIAHEPRLLDQRAQVGAGALLARGQPQHGAIEPLSTR